MLCILQQYHLLPPIYPSLHSSLGTAKAPSPTKSSQQKEIQDFTKEENHHVEDNMVLNTGYAEFQFKLMSSDSAKSSSIFHPPQSPAVCRCSAHQPTALGSCCPALLSLLLWSLACTSIAPLASDVASILSKYTTESCQGRFSLGVCSSVCPHTG